jgi:hypothetical protein
MCAGLYTLIGAHAYAFFTIIARLILKRVGSAFGLVWIAIGISLVYNICYNHFLAMTVKPGNVNDLIMIEGLRKKIKKRANRKEVDLKDQDE